jgi:hypothetical protein
MVEGRRVSFLRMLNLFTRVMTLSVFKGPLQHASALGVRLPHVNLGAGGQAFRTQQRHYFSIFFKR